MWVGLSICQWPSGSKLRILVKIAVHKRCCQLTTANHSWKKTLPRITLHFWLLHKKGNCSILYNFMMNRHANSREPGNLVPGHFWSKMQTFFRNQRFKEMNLKLCGGFEKNGFKWMTVSLNFFMKHHNIYTYNSWLS